MAMNKTTLYLPAGLQAELRRAARRTGRSQAQIIREAIERYVADLPDSFPTSIGIVSEASFNARDIDEILGQEWGGRDHTR